MEADELPRPKKNAPGFDVNPGRRRSGRPSRFVQHARFSHGPPLAVLEQALGRLREMVADAD